MTARPSHLVQLLLPLYDGAGAPVAKAAFDQVRETLVERFGGLTAYSQAPARGVWKDDEHDDGTRPVTDAIVVYEVMVASLDGAWWSAYRRDLEHAFGQKELVVRACAIQRL